MTPGTTGSRADTELEDLMRRRMFAAILAVALLAPAAYAQETPKLEDLVPDHTFLTVSLNDIAKSKAEFGRTGIWRLWREPEVQQFLAPALQFLDAQIEQAEKDLGHPIRGMLDLIRGQVGIALIEADPSGQSIPDVVLLVDFGEGVAEFRKVHDKLIAGHGEELELQMLEHEGVAYQTMVTPMGIEVAVGYLGNALAICSRPERMTSVIDGFKGNGQNVLANGSTYKKVVEHTQGSAAFLSVFFNMEGVLSYFGEQMDPMTLRVLEVTGLSSVRGLGMTSRFVGEGVRDTFFAYAPGEKKGMMEIFYTGSGDATRFLPRVPANAFWASAGSANWALMLDKIMEMAGEVDPAFREQIAEGIGQFEDQMGIDLMEDLLKPMGDDIALYAALPDGGGLIPDVVLMTRLKDPGRFLGSLSRMVDQARRMTEDHRRYQVEHRRMEFMGKEIHYVHVSHSRGDPFPVTPCFTLDGDIFVMALYPQVLKDFIARGKDSPSILTRPDFVRVRRGLPENLASIEYMDFQAGIKLLYGSLVPLAQMMGKDSNIPMDVALLPRSQTVAKHLFGGAWGMELRDDGVALHAYTPAGFLPLMSAMMAPALMFAETSRAPMMPTEFRVEPRPWTEAPVPPARMEDTPRAKLEEIYIALLYHYAQTDGYPGELGELLTSKVLEDPDALIVPWDDEPETTASGARTSFGYTGGAVGEIADGQSSAVWVYERSGLSGQGTRWVLFASGEVRNVPEAEFQKMLAATLKQLK